MILCEDEIWSLFLLQIPMEFVMIYYGMSCAILEHFEFLLRDVNGRRSEDMLVNRFLFFGSMVIINIALLICGVSPIMAGLITLVIIMTGYIGIAFRRRQRRLFLFEEACDPEAFLQSTEKQEMITGKRAKMAAFFAIDKSAAFISMGKFEVAKSLLESIDQTKLSEKNNSLLVYTINLMVCLYELGDISQAEYLFETQISILPPMNTRIKKGVNMLVGERYYYLRKYEEYIKHSETLMAGKLSRRTYLSILFRLAQIEEINGNHEKAKKKYKHVVEQGNKLWIVEQSRKRLGALE